MNRETVQAWLDNYIEAWRTYDASKIGNLFSDDALYFYNPFDEDKPVRGREAIIANWLADRDDPASWEAHYAPVAVEGHIGVAQGRTRYLRADGTLEREFANIFVLHFESMERCERFTECTWRRPSPASRVTVDR